MFYARLKWAAVEREIRNLRFANGLVHNALPVFNEHTKMCTVKRTDVLKLKMSNREEKVILN